MRGRRVGEGGIRKGRSLTGALFYGGWGWILGALGFTEREVKFVSGIDTVHRSCWGFWARELGYPLIS